MSSITKNLIYVSQFTRNNGVFFEFHDYHYVVKSQVNNEVLLHDNVGLDGLYSFSTFSLNLLQMVLLLIVCLVLSIPL